MNIFEYTKNLRMPLLIPNQSGKEITHNEALVILGNLVQNAVIDKNLSSPPTTPETGDLYIVGQDAGDEWLGEEQSLAIFDNGWRFIKPREGFLFYIIAESAFFVFKNQQWKKMSSLITLGELEDTNFLDLSENDILQYRNGYFINTNELNIEKILLNGKNKLEADENNNFSLKYLDSLNEIWEEVLNVENETGNIDFKKNVSFNGVGLEELTGSNITQADIDNKANVNLNNVSSNIDYVIEQYSDGNGNFYRKWKSGFVEQYGVRVSNAGTTVNLLIPFTNTNYTVISSTYYATGAGGISLGYLNITSRNLNSFTFESSSNAYSRSWHACGY